MSQALKCRCVVVSLAVVLYLALGVDKQARLTFQATSYTRKSHYDIYPRVFKIVRSFTVQALVVFYQKIENVKFKENQIFFDKKFLKSFV